MVARGSMVQRWGIYVLGIVGDPVRTAVSVTDLDNKHVNGEHVTDRGNANSKQQELEAKQALTRPLSSSSLKRLHNQ